MSDFGLQARSEIRRLLTDHDHRPRKGLGQNFLADPNIVDRIVHAAGVGATTNVVEIGAGTGALTTALARAAGRVVSYEVDHSLETILAETLAPYDNIELRFADVTRLDLDVALGPGSWTMVANLPYNVGTGIVLDTLQQSERVARLVVMVQKEVADRLIAGPGNKIYGIPSVVVSLHGSAHIAFTVPPHVFEPAPKVDSAVVVIDRQPADPCAGRAIEVATSAFGQRRKMLRRSLAAEIAGEAILVAAGVDPTARPEDLSPDAFVAIARAEASA